MAALLRHTVHLSRAGLRIPHHWQRKGNDPARVAPRPFVDVPVVVRAYHRGGLFAILGFHEQLTAEAREGRKTHRSQYAVGVHVLDAAMNVVAAGPDLFDARGFHSELRRWASRDRIERRVENLLAFVAP